MFQIHQRRCAGQPRGDSRRPLEILVTCLWKSWRTKSPKESGYSGIEVDGLLVGIMGVQPVKDVTLIRHAYVASSYRNKGLGGVLLDQLLQQTRRQIPGRDLGCGDLGDPVLREPRVPAGKPPREFSTPYGRIGPSPIGR